MREDSQGKEDGNSGRTKAMTWKAKFSQELEYCRSQFSPRQSREPQNLGLLSLTVWPWIGQQTILVLSLPTCKVTRLDPAFPWQASSLTEQTRWPPFEGPTWRPPSQWAPNCTKLSCPLHPHYRHDQNPLGFRSNAESTERQQSHHVRLSAVQQGHQWAPQEEADRQVHSKGVALCFPGCCSYTTGEAAHACTSNDPGTSFQ